MSGDNSVSSQTVLPAHILLPTPARRTPTSHWAGYRNKDLQKLRLGDIATRWDVRTQIALLHLAAQTFNGVPATAQGPVAAGTDDCLDRYQDAAGDETKWYVGLPSDISIRK